MSRRWAVLAGLLWAFALTGAVAAPAAVHRLQLAGGEDQTTLQIALSEAAQYRVFTLAAPERIVVDILSARLAPQALPLPAGAGAVRQLRAANRPDGSVRLVLDMARPLQSRASLRRAPSGGASEILVELLEPAAPASLPVATAAPPAPTAADPPPDTRAAAGPAPGPASTAAAAPSVPPPPAAPSGRDIVIAVDAGHGGKDPGAHGPRGVLEKDVTLRIARRLVEVINAEPGMRGVLTRSRDEFIPLRGRMERARAAQADLFVSVHADAVRNRRVKGASVYVLNEKGATDEAARRLAARENAADLIGGVSLRSQDRMLASVLLDLSQNASLSSSIEVADHILDELSRVGTVRKRQVMQAPFMVLKSPDVPSVLVETAYISNPDEERRLDSHEYRNHLATAIFSGVRNYFYRNPPRGTLVAELRRQRLAGSVEHVIRPGESLSHIATRYNVSVGRIRAANGLAGDRIAAGQVLRIPLVQET